MLSMGSEIGARSRQKERVFHQPAEAQEWQETGYWKLNKSQNSGIVPLGEFWLDYAEYLAGKPSAMHFLSHSVMMASENFTEAMFAIAVCNLPLQVFVESHST